MTTEARALVERLTGYTKGPWSFETEQDEWPDHALIGGDGDPVLEWDFDLGFRVAPANATLIAAAPDLHRHLTAALDEIDRLRNLFMPLASEDNCRCMFISRDTERAYETGTCPHQIARAAMKGAPND